MFLKFISDKFKTNRVVNRWLEEETSERLSVSQTQTQRITAFRMTGIFYLFVLFVFFADKISGQTWVIV